MGAQRASYPPANGGWRKFELNPVLGDEALGTCFDVYVTEDGAGYRMYFSWRNRKSLAVTESADGIRWSPPRVILEPRLDSGWEDDLNRNCVVKREDGYHMWYTGQARGHSWIGYATSADGYHFRRADDQPVLFSERPFEGESVMNPCVLWDEAAGLWRMWYSAGETYEPNVIAYADSPDGVNWRKLPANPVFVAAGNLPHEHERVGGCQIFRRDGWYYLLYIGYEDIDTARICLARSPDGITRWQRHPQNPILSPSAGEWDEHACYKPSAVWQPENRRWLLWYNGRRQSAEYIGMAVHDGYDLGF
ncbi:MAG: family 43 glycosylhydrolase [Clostridiales bacterium]|nr:family 43 glycosylhydrolase [Clostridiales bacterium]